MIARLMVAALIHNTYTAPGHIPTANCVSSAQSIRAYCTQAENRLSTLSNFSNVVPYIIQGNFLFHPITFKVFYSCALTSCRYKYAPGLQLELQFIKDIHILFNLHSRHVNQWRASLSHARITIVHADDHPEYSS
jgi:hypothetical protein